MQSFPATPTRAPAVMVTMLDDHVVICPPPRPDVETTEILVSAAAAAVRAGSTVMIDLDPATPSDALLLCGLRHDRVWTSNSDVAAVTVLGAGRVRLTTLDSHWTIDLAKSRFCQSATPVVPCFVTPDRWTPIRAIWATCTTVSVLKADGTYLSTRAAWTLGASRTRSTDDAHRGAGAGIGDEIGIHTRLGVL